MEAIWWLQDFHEKKIPNELVDREQWAEAAREVNILLWLVNSVYQETDTLLTESLGRDFFLQQRITTGSGGANINTLHALIEHDVKRLEKQLKAMAAGGELTDLRRAIIKDARTALETRVSAFVHEARFIADLHDV